ncbi:MAG TPA: hydroxymethylbilane synthase [Solirubrobacteraceae bacterium]|jgi:hydroxymethylbilane synthase
MRLGTRGSALALAQAALVAERLQADRSDRVEIVTIATTGDRDAQSADKSRWVLELERALLAGEIDLAVHSAKDVPGELGEGLELLGAPARAAVEDVLCLPAPAAHSKQATGLGGLEDLMPGARVGTSSVRRAAQLRAAREDLEIVTIRGNVDTRLRKLGTGGLDAIVLARAGLQRLDREAEIGALLDPARFVPAPGQGTLALEGRTTDAATRAAVQGITDTTAFTSLRAERAVAGALGASCATPLGVHAADAGCGCLHMHAWVGLPDGSAWIADELVGGFYDPEALGRRMAERLQSAGAEELLSRALELAGTQPTQPRARS